MEVRSSAASRVLPQPRHEHLERDRDHLAGLQRDRLLTPFPGAQAELAEDIAGRMDAQRQLLPSRRNDGGLDQTLPHEVDAACGLTHQVDELARRQVARRPAGEVVTELPATLAGEGDALRMVTRLERVQSVGVLLAGGIMRFLTVNIRRPPARWSAGRLLRRPVADSGPVRQPEKLVARLGAVAELPPQRAGDGLGVLLLHAAHHHAEVHASITTPTPAGRSTSSIAVRDLLGQPLLHLQPPREHLDDPRQLGQPDDLARSGCTATCALPKNGSMWCSHIE